MTKEEAYIFLGDLSDFDDLEDAYEVKLFDEKQYFISKPIIARLFQSRISKMLKIHDAYIVLGGSNNEIRIQSDFELHHSDKIVAVVESYHINLSKFKKKILESSNAHEIQYIIERFFTMYNEYLDCWKEVQIDDESGIMLSKEIDAMELIRSISEFELKGYCTFSDIQTILSEENENNLLKPLIMESKRLSLQRKKSKNE